MQPAPSNRLPQGRHAQLAADDLPAREAPRGNGAAAAARNPFASPERSGVRDTVAAAPRNPFASLDKSSVRDTGAETKLYEVPRELIEIARAHAGKSRDAGTTTPLAPRPGAELEAAVRSYTMRLSNEPPRVPVDLLEAATAPEVSVEPEPEPLLLTARRANAAPSGARAIDQPRVREAQPHSTSRAWLIYVALWVTALALCARVLVGS